MDIWDHLGIRPVINARSYSTKLGGAPLPSSVLDAMRQISGTCVRMDELQEAAGRTIAAATGADTGIVTSGAAAGLTLAAAAALCGLDVSRMNRLSDTAGMPNEILLHRSHRNDYDHALRAAGARLVEVGFSYYTFAYEVEQAISPSTTALFYHAGGAGRVMPLAEFVAIAHKHHKPVIVDAAAELPPAQHLRSFIEAGADLVVFSGGKHLRGPQSTGILCGRSDLILSAALQHQDMDIFPHSWPLRQLIADGRLAGPPHHGIGRGFKVGKEEIAGLMAALLAYPHRDFATEQDAWMRDMTAIVAAAQGPGVRAFVRFPQDTGRMVPHAVVTLDAAVAGIDANAVINALQEGEPRIFCFEQLGDDGTIIFMPEGLNPGEAGIVARRLQEILTRKS